MNKNKKLSTINYQLSTSSGFTLIELLISMALIAVLTGSAIQVARFSDTHKNLTLAANEMSAVIRSAQSSSLSIPNPIGQHVCGFGVRFGVGGNTRYEMFYTFVDNATFTANPKTCDQNSGYRGGTPITNYTVISDGRHALPAGATFDASDVGKTIFFKVPYGDVFDENGDALDATDFEIEIDSGVNSRDITVTPSGQVE